MTQTRNACPKWKEEVPRCRTPSRHVSDMSWLQACLVLGVDGDQLPSSQGWSPPPRGVVFSHGGTQSLDPTHGTSGERGSQAQAHIPLRVWPVSLEATPLPSLCCFPQKLCPSCFHQFPP